jgi:hypothetical protein
VHAGNIRLRYRTTGTGIYRLQGQVPVLDEGSTPISGATVTAEWALPNGQTTIKSAVTGANGAARFQVRSRQEGIYTLTVLDIEASGYVYDPDQNQETSEELLVP